MLEFATSSGKALTKTAGDLRGAITTSRSGYTPDSLGTPFYKDGAAFFNWWFSKLSTFSDLRQILNAEPQKKVLTLSIPSGKHVSKVISGFLPYWDFLVESLQLGLQTRAGPWGTDNVFYRPTLEETRTYSIKLLRF